MKRTQWLFNEIENWQDSGLVSSDQATRIKALYDSPQSNAAWGKIVFAAIGAVLIGLGVILMFAYNWEDMHRFTKLTVVFSALASAHGLGLYYSQWRPHQAKIGESFHLLGSMLFGAGIWVVAQVYHIDDHYPNAFLLWSLGTLAMAWALPSKPQLLLALALISAWHYSEVFNFQRSNGAGILLVLLAAIPLAWKLQSPSTLFASVLLFLFNYAASYAELAEEHSETTWVVLLCLSSACIAASFFVRNTLYSNYHNPFRLLGAAVFAITLFVTTFEDLDDMHFDSSIATVPAQTLVYFFTAIVITFLGWFGLFLKRERLTCNTDLFESAIVAAATVTAIVFAFLPTLASVSWLLFNLLFLGYCIVLIYRGTQQLRWQSTALGSLLLSAFAFARFMDLFESLLMRGTAFLVIGGLLFGAGLLYSHKKSNRHGKEAQHHDTTTA